MISLYKFTLSPAKWLVATLVSCYLLAFLPATVRAQCTFSQGTGPVISRDFDVPPAPPYVTSAGVFSPAIGAMVDVTSPLTITICFWGDMEAANETFSVVISGQSFPAGAFGVATTQGTPACLNFTVPAAAVEADLADGDIDISYTTFGAGWTIDPMTGGADDFNAQVQSLSFDFNIPVTLTDPSDRCTDGADATFVGSPADGATMGDMSNYAIFPATAAVGFHLPEATEATLTVYDETGRLVYAQTGQFSKGYNTFQLERALLNTSGLLVYKLETPDNSASRKMLQVK